MSQLHFIGSFARNPGGLGGYLAHFLRYPCAPQTKNRLEIWPTQGFPLAFFEDTPKMKFLQKQQKIGIRSVAILRAPVIPVTLDDFQDYRNPDSSCFLLASSIPNFLLFGEARRKHGLLSWRLPEKQPRATTKKPHSPRNWLVFPNAEPAPVRVSDPGRDPLQS